MYEIRIIKKEQQRTSKWAGGTTTEIAIYPPESSYTGRDFLWRLSTAVVELEESTFTKLLGYDRQLMVLEGELRIVHKEQHTAYLKQYEQDSFKGGWDTVSYGKARDFNLMLREGLTGELEHYPISKGQLQEFKLAASPAKQCFFACYCHKGHISFSINNHCAAIGEGDLLLVEYDEDLTVTAENKGIEEGSLVVCRARQSDSY